MATLIIDSIPLDLHRRIRETAASHGRSVSQEAVQLLAEALGESAPQEPAAAHRYWENPALLPEYAELLAAGKLGGGVDSGAAVTDDRSQG